MIERQTSKKMSSREIKKLTSDELELMFNDEHLVITGEVGTSNIEFLTHHINRIEKVVKEKIKIREPFQYLHTVPGIGDILALTIMLEVGEISRFPKVGNFSSYCRCVSSNRYSDEKKKGKGNTKNGNRYLAWAFVEAVHFARRFSPRVKKYYQRKEAKRNKIVAIKALSNKLARACYYIIRDQVPFKEDGLFC